MSEEGKKFDQDKLRMDLLPVEGLKGVAEVLTFGASKYGDRNWENGIDYNRVYGAALRHLSDWWAREDLDDESALNHLKHAACCLMFLITFVERGMHEFDNRPKKHPKGEFIVGQKYQKYEDEIDFLKGRDKCDCEFCKPENHQRPCVICLIGGRMCSACRFPEERTNDA